MKIKSIAKSILVSTFIILGVSAFNGQETQAATNRHPQSGVIRVVYNGRGKVRLLDANGHYVHQYVNRGSRWKIFERGTINGKTMYRLGSQKQWIPAQYASLNGFRSANKISGIHNGTVHIALPSRGTYFGITPVSFPTNSGVTPGVDGNYLTDLNGQRHQISRTSADRVAQQIASCINSSSVRLTDEERIGLAATYVAQFCQQDQYTMKGKYYAQPYGVFIAHQYSCAGATRAVGLVLNYLGYSFLHANANEYTHQWAIVKTHGRTYWADAQTGVFGEGSFGQNGKVFR